MAQISLYQFYRSYLNYPKGNNRYYARAVQETNALFKEVLIQKSILPLLRYQQREYKNPVTLKLLENLVKIAEENYETLFKDIEHFETTIIIDKKNLTSRRRGIFVNAASGIDKSKEKIIFLVYGSGFKIIEENNILVGLMRHFPITKKFPVRISKIEYWNLSKGEKCTIDTKELKIVDKSSLIDAANRI